MSELSESLIRLGEEEFEESALREKEFTKCEAADALLKDLRRTPHAFVLGCLMDQQIKAKRAWAIPYKISQELRSFSMQKLQELRLDQWTEMFKEKSLHRHHNRMSNFFFLGVHKIATQYGGDASQIWSGNPSSNDVVLRFRQFKGAGQKISTMAANILVRRFRIPMSDYRAIDISVDVHIERVMQRMGLVPAAAKSETIIDKARALNPEFPGVFDYACWKIGKDWCKPQKPDCKNCPVCSDCKKKIL